MVDRNGKKIMAGQTIRVLEQKTDALTSPGVYQVRTDSMGKLIIMPGVAVTELSSSIVEVVEDTSTNSEQDKTDKKEG